MKKILLMLGLLGLIGHVAFGDVLPPPAATQVEVNAGIVGNKYVSPKTLAGWTGGSGGSGGGGIVSNSMGLTFSLETRYTNTTDYAYVSASAALTTTASASDTAAIAVKVDTDANGTYEYTAHQVAQQGRAATALSYTAELGAIVPPRAVFIYDGTVAASGGVDIPIGSGQIVYFSTNGASGGGGGGVSAAEVVAIVRTNTAGGATNLYDAKGIYTQPMMVAVYENDGQFIGPSIKGGHPQNFYTPGLPGVVLFGGITNTSSGAAYTNTILDRISTIAGGVGNFIGTLSEGSFIGAGEQCLILEDSSHCVIVGGEVMTIGPVANWSGILGGHHVAIGNGADYSFVVGGIYVTNNGSTSFIGSGTEIFNSGNGSQIVGGEYISNTGANSFIGGGHYITNTGTGSQIVGGTSNLVSGNYSGAFGNSLVVTNNREFQIGTGANHLSIKTNGTVTANGNLVFTGDGSGLTNQLTSYAVQAGGTAATITSSDELLNFGTTDPSFVITNAGVYLLQGGASMIFNNWTPDIVASTLILKLRRTAGGSGADNISGAAVGFDLNTTDSGRTDPLGQFNFPAVIYTSAGSETIQLWGTIGVDGASGSIQATAAWITAVRIR